MEKKRNTTAARQTTDYLYKQAKNRNIKMVRELDALMALQTSDHNTNSNKTSNKDTQPAIPISPFPGSFPLDAEEEDLHDTSPPRQTSNMLKTSFPMHVEEYLYGASPTQYANPITPLPLDVKEVDLYGASPPRHTSNMLETKLDNRVLNFSSLMSYFFPAKAKDKDKSKQKEEEKEEEVDLYGASPLSSPPLSPLSHMNVHPELVEEILELVEQGRELVEESHQIPATYEGGEEETDERRQATVTYLQSIGIDQESFNSLPKDIQEEITQIVAPEEETEKLQQATATFLQSLDIDQEFLNSLPTDIQEEVILQAARERGRFGRDHPEMDISSPSTPRQASVHVNSEPNSHGSSTNSSTSSEATPQLTPSASVDDFEGDLIDLNEEISPSHVEVPTLSNQSSHQTLKSPLINRDSFTQTEVAAPSRQVHQGQPSTVLHTITITIPKHELFFHNLPSQDASVVQVRAWISSWFAGRDIPFEGRWKGTDVGLQDYIDCISWSGDDLYNTGLRNLENDLRGWMLGGYARPIVKDIEKALYMARDRKWEAISKRAVGFFCGVLFAELVEFVLIKTMRS